MGSCCHASGPGRAALTSIFLPFEAPACPILIQSSTKRGQLHTRRVRNGQRQISSTRDANSKLRDPRRWASGPAVTCYHGGQRHPDWKFFHTGIGCAIRKEDRPVHERDDTTIQSDLEELSGLDSVNLDHWRRAFDSMLETHGPDGVWAVFELAMRKNKLHMLLEPEAKGLAEIVIAAAARDDTRLQILTSVNRKLRVWGYTSWPNFYSNVMQSLVRLCEFERTLRWYRKLDAALRPTPIQVAEMFASLAVDESRPVQKSLRDLYLESPGLQLYDYVVPVLFNAGKLRLARIWRKTCIKSRDFPLSPKSRDFLNFMTSYLPQIDLEVEEVAIMRRNDQTWAVDAENEDAHEMNLHDTVVAKWFASSWLGMEFAINFAFRLGTRTVGPLALQALALRDSEPRIIAERIGQLEAVGMHLSSDPYCKAIRHFSASGDNKLLSNLLRSDVHPTEFNDPSRRGLLLNDAIRRQDFELQNLLKGFEAAVDDHSIARKLNRLLERDLHQQSTLKSALLVLDRMSTMQINVSEENGLKLLDRVFRGRKRTILGWPDASYRDMISKNPNDMDRALGVTRQLSVLDFPVPLWHWKQLLYNLGHAGRINDLKRVGLEFVRLFKRRSCPLIPVFDSKTDELSPEKLFVPTELPVSYSHHPVQKVFDLEMLRFIVMCGFQRALTKPPPSNLIGSSVTEVIDHGIASGISVLATLRDCGVTVHAKAVQYAIIKGIVMLRMSKPSSIQNMDSFDISLEGIKKEVDEAWGDELFPSVDEMVKAIEKKQLRDNSTKAVQGSRWYEPRPDHHIGFPFGGGFKQEDLENPEKPPMPTKPRWSKTGFTTHSLHDPPNA